MLCRLLRNCARPLFNLVVILTAVVIIVLAVLVMDNVLIMLDTHATALVILAAPSLLARGPLAFPIRIVGFAIVRFVTRRSVIVVMNVHMVHRFVVVLDVIVLAMHNVVVLVSRAAPMEVVAAPSLLARRPCNPPTVQPSFAIIRIAATG